MCLFVHLYYPLCVVQQNGLQYNIFDLGLLININPYFSYFTVDDLEKCSNMVGKDQTLASKLQPNVSAMPPARKKNPEPRKYFPFKQGYLAVAILRVGAEGI